MRHQWNVKASEDIKNIPERSDSGIGRLKRQKTAHRFHTIVKCQDNMKSNFKVIIYPVLLVGVFTLLSQGQSLTYCTTGTCANNGQCVQDGLYSYHCDCTDCYTGQTCQTAVQDANPCYLNPCLNYGTCVPIPGSCTEYICACANCYEGNNCQTLLNPCSPNPCVNGGVCSQRDCQNFFCQCPSAGCFSGDRCEILLNPCDPNPCSNGGICVQDINSCTSYTCTCQECWTGTTCTTPYDPCQPNRCLNGAACQPSAINCREFSCACVECFEGDFCESFINQCVPSPCLNGGVCVSLSPSCTDYTCSCPPCYIGFNCGQKQEPCVSNPCLNGATCVVTSCTTRTCQCEECYRGISCQFLQDPCQPNRCLNGGVCSAVANSCTDYTCTCTTCYTGNNCDQLSENCTDVTTASKTEERTTDSRISNLSQPTTSTMVSVESLEMKTTTDQSSASIGDLLHHLESLEYGMVAVGAILLLVFVLSVVKCVKLKNLEKKLKLIHQTRGRISDYMPLVQDDSSKHQYAHLQNVLYDNTVVIQNNRAVAPTLQLAPPPAGRKATSGYISPVTSGYISPITSEAPSNPNMQIPASPTHSNLSNGNGTSGYISPIAVDGIRNPIVYDYVDPQNDSSGKHDNVAGTVNVSVSGEPQHDQSTTGLDASTVEDGVAIDTRL
ncbi:neurogenic locus Notch protein-like [Ptychodera flava]|uniref:neurogenic locus Notch protein-like n=1 Tax=Ptychodera flava TaxID=63121 RepID=UPI003969E9A1